MKIANSGSHRTGKTTLALAVVEQLDDGAGVVLEVSRQLVDEVGEPRFFRRGANTFNRQCLILASQVETESRLAAGQPAVFVCDRSVVDHWAYTRVLFGEAAASSEGKLWEALAWRWSKTYDLVFITETVIPPADDGVREADIHFQRKIRIEIQSIYDSRGMQTRAVSGTTDERRAAILASLTNPRRT